MLEQTRQEAGREAALADLAKIKRKSGKRINSRSAAMIEETKKRGPGRPPKVKTGWLAKVVADMPSVTVEAKADKMLQPKRGPGRPPKAEVTPKNLVGMAKKPGRPKGSGKGKPGRPKGSGKRRGPGRPKGKPGRPKGKGKRGRPRASGKVSKGFIAGAVAKQVKPLLKAQSKALKEQVKTLVAKEVKKALKAALR